jgi:PqqD family protein of HPr-rel-A system
MIEPSASDPTSQESVSVPLTYRPRKGRDVLELDMGDGLILYNHDSNLVHHLNPSAAIVWQLCDGDGTVAELARDIAEEYDVNSVQVQKDIGTLVGEFDALGLVDDVGSPTAR